MTWRFSWFRFGGRTGGKALLLRSDGYIYLLTWEMGKASEFMSLFVLVGCKKEYLPIHSFSHLFIHLFFQLFIRSYHFSKITLYLSYPTISSECLELFRSNRFN
jgi:hypothetical protein